MDDLKIINGIKSKDSKALCLTVNKYSKLLWHVCTRILRNAGSPEDIEECVADVFVFLWENPCKYSPNRASLKSWLSFIAKNKAIDKFRTLTKRNELFLDEDIVANGMEVAEIIELSETKGELVAAINTLSEPMREIVIRRYYYSQKPKEIGFSMNITTKQVENHLYQAKKKLRENLKCSENIFG